MTELEKNLTERIERLERLFAETVQSNDAIVDAEYVAKIFDCTAEAVKRGRRGTANIPRVSDKPVRFKKSDVDRFLSEPSKPNKTLSEKVNAALLNAKPVKRRKSIITKNK